MSLSRDQILAALARIALPDGGDLVSRDVVRALTVEGDRVSFVLEAPDPDLARRMEPQRQAAEAAVRSLGAGTFRRCLPRMAPRPRRRRPR